MKNIFVSSWSEQIQQVLSDLADQLLLEEHNELNVHLILEHSSETCLKEQMMRNHPNVSCNIHFYDLDSKLPISQKIKQVQSLIRSIGEDVERIYLRFHEEGALIQQMLAHECTQIYPNKVVFFTDYRNRSQFSLGQAIHERQLYNHVYELVVSGNFLSAKKLVTDRVQNPLIVSLLELGHKLRMLDIEERESMLLFDQLKEALKLFHSGQHDEEGKFVDLFKSLQKQNQKAFIAFLFNYAELLYDEHDLIDFIVLYYRLAEETLLYALGWDIPSQRMNDATTFVMRKDAKYKLLIPEKQQVTRHLHSYMKVLSQEVRRLEERYHVRIRRDRCVGLERLSSRDRYFAELYLFFKNKQLEKFLKLRHEGVSGHGFADFTREKLEAIFEGRPPLEKMAELLEKLSLKPPYSIFKLIQKAVLGLVGEEKRAKLVK
ncbi:hypothetical protein LH47_01392 [Anoxybacillus thermarum]|uniref:Uncharacterized protein n=1 Tax=Anoxybacillus thermarum TaxID=404937 RepID=A0A0D0QYK4_9BACL|nr:hypothetical protein [Anoxybacillus thermarum]KIQ94514.1 hypothetical protein LH47_01392 [Anoxybacillus thermarum]